MKLNNVSPAKEYKIVNIDSLNEGMNDFLFSLGCYPGEKISIISLIASNYIVSIKDSRYSIDENLASAIVVEDIRLESLAI